MNLRQSVVNQTGDKTCRFKLRNAIKIIYFSTSNLLSSRLKNHNKNSKFIKNKALKIFGEAKCINMMRFNAQVK